MQVQLTQSRLRELLDYSPETGVFTNRITRSANAVAGTEIKCLDSDGYVQLRLDGVSHKAHRLAWFYMTGQWPSGAIDHINGLRNDNRFSNLRDTTLSINSQNMRHARTDSKAMQNIAVINGRPSLWGDSVIALVKSSPSCEYVVEEATDDKATCRVKRRGEPEQVRVFTKDDAKTAGLIGKQGPWTQYPKRMMQMRARSWALRDVFPDVLRGMPIAEEVMDISEKEINPMPPRQTGTQAGEAARTAPIVDSAERNELIASLEETAREIGIEAYAEKWKNLSAAQRKMVGADEHERLKKLAMTPSSELKTGEVIDGETGEVQS